MCASISASVKRGVMVCGQFQPPLELSPVDWEKIDAEPEDEIITEIRATRRMLMEEREAESSVVREELPKK